MSDTADRLYLTQSDAPAHKFPAPLSLLYFVVGWVVRRWGWCGAPDESPPQQQCRDRGDQDQDNAQHEESPRVWVRGVAGRAGGTNTVVIDGSAMPSVARTH